MFDPRDGDLCFQDLGDGAAEGASAPLPAAGVDGRNIDHVALFARSDQGRPGVIEAIPPRVRWTPLRVFLERHVDAEGRPSVLVARVRPGYRHLVPTAVAVARSLIGRPFDEWYGAETDGFHCSELIVSAFRRANGGRSLFTRLPSTSRGERPLGAGGRTGPGSEPGSTPGSLSRAPILEIVHVFGRLGPAATPDTRRLSVPTS